MEKDASAQKARTAQVYIGCAGWNLPAVEHARFPSTGTHLQRYAAIFPAVEINTSFYRPHRPSTYARWRDSVPEAFRFAAKIPRAITHEMRLQNPEEALKKFMGEAGELADQLGCLLVQLPPRLRYDAPVAQRFFRTLRALTEAAIVCEPRHPSWFAAEAADMLYGMRIAYVNADPSVAPVPQPPDSLRLDYLRLHGSPEMYHSAYSETWLDCLAAEVACKAHAGRQVWCIFDNTASGAAVPNALSLLARLRGTVPAPA
jgi:uncharacterized protein YecE (DUF72 family)